MQRVYIYPKIAITMTVPDDFDEAEWQNKFSLAVVRALRNRLRTAVEASPGVTYVSSHIHHSGGSSDE